MKILLIINLLNLIPSQRAANNRPLISHYETTSSNNPRGKNTTTTTAESANDTYISISIGDMFVR